MKLDAIMKLNQRQIEKMSRQELARVVSDLRSVARKRIERMEKSEVYSPAYTSIISGGGIPTVKGMDITQLRNEFKRYKGFVEMKTSTVRGARTYQRKLKNNFEKMVGRSLTNDEMGFYSRILDDLRDEGLATANNYKNVLNYITEYSNDNPELGSEELKQQVREVLENEYEQTTRGFYSSDRF